MSEELKPCQHCECVAPFTPRVNTTKNNPVSAYWVECPCGMKTAEYSHPSAAIRQWNTRHTTQAQVDDYLKENGLVAVPVEPTEALLEPISDSIDDAYAEHETDSSGVYKAIIKAAKVEE